MNRSAPDAVVVEVRDVLVGGSEPLDVSPRATRTASWRPATVVLAALAVAVAGAGAGAALSGSFAEQAPASEVLLRVRDNVVLPLGAVAEQVPEAARPGSGHWGTLLATVDGTACEGDFDWHRSGDDEGGSGVVLACDDGSRLGARLSVRTSDGQQRWQVLLRLEAEHDRR